MTELRVGDVLENRYRVDHPIAQGGMSTVYRCIDLRLGRAVAVKVIDERLNRDPEFRDRFRSEARAMAKLSNPSLVDIYDFGSSGGHLFFVMELIDGGTLRELLAEHGTMPPHAATAILRALLQGLTAVHRAGMVHRDIKPDNVLITQDHQVKLSDFGLIRPGNQKRLTNEKIVGTVSYLSPEQVNGAPIGPESDVYSAGIVGYEMLAGETPFHGETPLARAMARTTTPVPPPSSKVPGIPRLIDELIASATALDPSQRFRNASEFLDALNDVAQVLGLPNYEIPAPQNAAASRAAAVPTEVSEMTAGATTVLNSQATHSQAQAAPHSEETRIIRDQPAETRFIDPRGDAIPDLPPRQYQQEVAPQPGAIVPRDPQLAQRRPEYASRPVKPVTNRSAWKLGFGVFFALITVAAIAVAGWWVGSGRYGEVPQILGLDTETATQAVMAAGFSVTTEAAYSDTVPEDSVVESRPQSGDKAPKGSSITLLISQGQPTVPTIPGSGDRRDYEQLLSERTLRSQEGASVYSEDVEEGFIVSVDPSPGSTVNTNSSVIIHLSKGAEPLVVPDLEGMELSSAREELQSMGLTVGKITQSFNSSVDRDHVISTDPEPGSDVKKGDTVRLKVSTAARIPNVTGIDVEDAKAELADMGIRVKEIRRDASMTDSDPQAVVSVSPPADTVVNPESQEVILTVPGTIEVPSVIGLQGRDAESKLSSLGFTVSYESDSSRSGLVISQSPDWLSSSPYGSTITLRTMG